MTTEPSNDGPDRSDEIFDYDRVCTHCGGRMVASSTWTATDPDRSWQAIVRYCCEGCDVQGVVTIGQNRANVYGGFVSEERYDSEVKPENAETVQMKLVTDGGIDSSGMEQKSDGEKLVEGLRDMMDERTPDDEYHCPKCGEYAEFVVLQTVERPEFGVENDVIGCPDCRYTLIDATEWRSIDTETEGGQDV